MEKCLEYIKKQDSKLDSANDIYGQISKVNTMHKKEDLTTSLRQRAAGALWKAESSSLPQRES